MKCFNINVLSSLLLIFFDNTNKGKKVKKWDNSKEIGKPNIWSIEKDIRRSN